LRMGGMHHQLKYIEQFAGVSAGKAEQGFVFFDLDGMFLQVAVLRNSLFQNSGQFLLGEMLQYVYLTTGEQSGNHLERGIFGGSADERHQPAFYGPEQRILLRFGKAMDLIDKKDRLLLIELV